MCSQIHAVTACSGNQLDNRLSGPYGKSGCSGEEKKLLPPPEIKLWSSNTQPVTLSSVSA